MLAFYFAVAGFLGFTVLVIQSAGALVRSLARSGPAAAGVAVSALFLVSLAAIDTAFAVLLLRALQVAWHSPAISG